MAGQGNDAIIAGVASILQQASAALARLGAVERPGPTQSANAGSSIAGAAAALAQVAAQLGPAVSDAGRRHLPARYEDVDEDTEPNMSTQEFCDTHKLEPWVGEALDLLVSSQRAAVTNPQMNVGRVRNMNGIVVSRIKQAVPLDQRLGIFVQINGLSEGVVDRISTLSADQAEALLDTGFKIQKAENPSAVAMKRITDVIRASNAERSSGRSSRQQRDSGHPWSASARGSARQDRSRTPAGPRFRASAANSNGASDTPEDIQAFMDQLGLEWWCGEVLKRLSLWQRQQIIKDLSTLHGVRNPSGVVMSRVKTTVDTSELMSIFVDINQFDRPMQEQLMTLNPEQQQMVINPGIYLQNVRNPNTAVRSRINNVLAGRDAFGKPIAS